MWSGLKRFVGADNGKTIGVLFGAVVGGFALFAVNNFIINPPCDVVAEGLPDTFRNCEANSTSPASTFDIQERWASASINQAYQTPIVGDLYGSGEPVAVVQANRGSGGSAVQDRRSFDLNIFQGSDGTLLDTITAPYYIQWAGHASAAMADVDGDGEGEIIVKAWYHANDDDTYEGRLVAYEADGTEKWISDERIDFNTTGDTFVESRGRGGMGLNIADFNGDDTPEVYVGNRIFNASTGNLVAAAVDEAASAGCPLRADIDCHWGQSTAVDMDGDGVLELVAGDTVYKVDIANTTGTANGEIVDPVGPALSPNAPDTGFQAKNMILPAFVVAVGAAAIFSQTKPGRKFFQKLARKQNT